MTPYVYAGLDTQCMSRITNLILDINRHFRVDITSQTRKRNVSLARQTAMYMLNRDGYTYQEIGDALNRNHATILHGASKVKFMLEYDKAYIKMFGNFIDTH